MKILLANSTCKVGGVSTFMLALRSGLIALGHQCELFFFQRGTMERHLPPDVRVHFGTLADCLRLVARERIDVVHANNVDWPTGISAVRHAGAKLVLTAHKARESAWTYGWTTANCDAMAAVSNWIGKDLQPYTDVPIQIVPNGIDTRRFSPRESGGAMGPPIVAWIGRGASPLKGLDIFAAAAPALR
ncbi:MAG: glycosyltransferase, partial [Luteitalea sp.]|nr:glycosyltransferase [Luteitalea sp.]